MDTNGEIRRRKVRKIVKSKPFLPDDIILNILSRLPAKNAIRFRLVCKGWRDLTLMPVFVDLHFRHSIPMIFVAEAAPTPFLLDKWWEATRPRSMVHRHPTSSNSNDCPLFSHGGLIVYGNLFDKNRRCIVHNPVGCEYVRVTCSDELRRCEIYGVFFHPLLKEYCSLWKIQQQNRTPDTQPKQIQYKMLIFGHNPFFKTIKNPPFIHRVDRYPLYPSFSRNYPLFIHKYLYWMLDPEQVQDYPFNGRSDIMQFDIISEEFTVKPCPIPIDTKCCYNQTYLLNIDGVLSYLLIFPSKITILKLEDHASQLWTAANYTFSIDICRSLEELPTPIAVVDGNLALSLDRRLLVCNLMHGTTKYLRQTKYNKHVLFFSHQLSLASLRNCKSDIHIDQDGEIDLKGNSLIIAGRW